MARPASSEASKYPPTEFSLKYAKVLAPNGKLITPEEAFGEGGLFDKDVEEKTRLAFKVTMKKLEKYNVASEKNKEQLKSAKVDQVVECFPNTLLKLLPNTITKIKWAKKPAEIENWDHWWDIHQKILTPLKAQVCNDCPLCRAGHSLFISRFALRSFHIHGSLSLSRAKSD